MRTVDYREEELFLGAIECASPAARATYLDEHCAEDADLRHRVEALTRLHGTSDFLLDEPLDAQFAETPFDAPGTVIGNYTLIRQIGEGGMGAVYSAEQTQPVRRKVAIKIIKLGMDTREVIARFEAERQALAMMEHPSITKVFDAGATATGRPYFVMELVTGPHITGYCNEHRLSLRERMRLFIQVCHAVQHAHQKGVIHRDIKPSNVLITTRDEQPLPKVIDFGIAKATHQRLTEVTPFTDYTAMMGTPEYMSPEQADMNSTDIDTRSDIYSLGVLLYELITGDTPFRGKELRGKNYHQIREVIQTREPERPSLRLSKTSDQDLQQLAAERVVDVNALQRAVRGDLDWIAMKCLSKDRTRRYETAADLAREIKRHLAGEPVDAAAPTLVYKFSKFAHKHRSLLSVAAGIGVVLALSAVVSTTLAIRAHSEAERARTAQLLANQRLDEANRAWQSAEFERQRARSAEKELVASGRSQRNQLAISRAVARFNALALQLHTEQLRSDPAAVLANIPGDLATEGLEISQWMKQELGELQEIVILRGEPTGSGQSPQDVPRVPHRQQWSDVILLRLILDEQRQAFGAADVLVAETLDALGERLLNSGAIADAVACMRESLLIRSAGKGEPAARLRTRVFLGKALARLGKPNEARRHLQSAREALVRLPQLSNLDRMAEAELIALGE